MPVQSVYGTFFLLFTSNRFDLTFQREIKDESKLSDASIAWM